MKYKFRKKIDIGRDKCAIFKKTTNSRIIMSVSSTEIENLDRHNDSIGDF